jgi:MFS superfamily sulfate permease-like transporter
MAHLVEPLARQINVAKAMQMVPGFAPPPVFEPFRILGSLAVCLLAVEVGIACLAVVLGVEMRRDVRPARLASDIAGTVALIMLAAVIVAVIRVLPPLIEINVFEPGRIPLGFGSLHVFALTTMLLLKWVGLVVAIALMSVVHGHYANVRGA